MFKKGGKNEVGNTCVAFLRGFKVGKVSQVKAATVRVWKECFFGGLVIKEKVAVVCDKQQLNRGLMITKKGLEMQWKCSCDSSVFKH